MQTLVLARETAGHVTAVDRHQPFLDELDRRTARNELTDRITTLNASMSALDFPDATFDLIWSEAAIYIMGFAEGLGAWKGEVWEPMSYLSTSTTRRALRSTR